MIRLPSVLFLPFLLLLVSNMTFAQDMSEDDEETRAKAAVELTFNVASSMSVRTVPAEGESVESKLLETPLLRWSNPEAGSVHGAVFLWTDDNRPQLVASIFKWYSPHVWLDAEVHSLSEQPLIVNREGATLWSTHDKSVKFIRLQGTPAPADTPVKRLSQMRALVREMDAEQTTRETQENQLLRALERPLYRYQSNKHHVIDGGLFAFVWATDPQILVQIEAREDGKETYWQAAFVRQTSCAMRLKRNDQLVYEVEQLPWPVAFGNSELYNILRITQ